MSEVLSVEGWEGVTSATYSLRQLYTYTYRKPIVQLTQKLMVFPPERHRDATRGEMTISVNPEEGAKTQFSKDRFGNTVVEVEVLEVTKKISFLTKTKVVRTLGMEQEVVDWGDFLEESELTEATEELVKVGRQFRLEHPRDEDLGLALCDFVHNRLRYEFGATGVLTNAAQSLEAGRGLCQDFSHVLLALARGCGIPGRYVSGHTLKPGGSHAWTELLLNAGEKGERVIGFDPSNNCVPGWEHVVVAVGRDYFDVAPTSGRFVGEAGGVLRGKKHVEVVEVTKEKELGERVGRAREL